MAKKSNNNERKVLDCGMIGQCKLQKVKETFASFEVVTKTTQTYFECTIVINSLNTMLF